MSSIEDALSDIQVGVVRTLALVCNHLIDQRLLNRDLLIADLGQVQTALAKANVGVLGLAVPAGLGTALRQSADEQP